MTPRARAETAATLRLWAGLCLRSSYESVWSARSSARALGHRCCNLGHCQPTAAALMWVETRVGEHSGPTAALALCFAAAMVEAGDSAS